MEKGSSHALLIYYSIDVTLLTRNQQQMEVQEKISFESHNIHI